MQIRKRWPLLFAAGSALIYMGNHYHISGLEHLKLVPRAPISRADATGYSNGGQASLGYSTSSVPLPSTSGRADYHSGPAAAAISTPAAGQFEDLPPWGASLSVGEKMAVIQDNLAKQISGIVQSHVAPSSAFPLNAPIPLPSEIEMTRPDTSGQASVSSVGSSMLGVDRISASPFPNQNITTIRVATFNAHPLDPVKLAKSNVVDALVSILVQFDLVALQGIQSDRDDIMPFLVESLGRSGRRFDYLIGPRTGPELSAQQFAFLFDSTKIETDRYQLYTVDDPEKLMTYDPLVAWFRCKDVSTEDAFTFSMINLRINSQAAIAEQNYLPNLIHAVVHDGRQEDDVLVAGDFAGNVGQISGLQQQSIRMAVRDTPNDTVGTAALSSILFSAQGTVEYTGKSGTFDFLRKYNLPIEQATAISHQLPVWAEFLATEGAEPGRIAPTTSSSSL